MENSKAPDGDLKDIYLFISSSINKICKELTKFSSETMKVIEKSVYNFNKLNG